MSAWIWVLIPLVAIIGGYIIDYQKNKLKWQNQTSNNETELEEIRLIIQQVKKRIENLEAIAVNDPGNFKASESGPFLKIELDGDEEFKRNNSTEVERLAKQKGEKL